MRLKKGQVLPTFEHTVTVLNKMKAEDCEDGIDKWFATVIEKCFFKKKELRDANGNVIGASGTYVCRIPIKETYKPYREWVKDTESNFTFSPGDYVIKGELEASETIDNKTIMEIYQNHKPDIFSVESFAEDRHIPYAEHYKIEGV